MRRGAWIVAGVTIAAAASVGGVLIASRDDVTPAERAARDACKRVEEFTQIVERDGSAADASRALREAERFANQASKLDVSWIALESGVQTLQLALSSDDAGAADTGLRVVQAHCLETG